ncbi:MAG: rRNA maturation RNase YbeY [Lacipirellulaceae bacterium]
MRILIANQQNTLAIDEARLTAAARDVLAEHGFARGELSIAVVDDPTIQALNVRHLQHDYPTDVLSFCFDEDADRLEGEVVVSADTAVRNAAEYGWPAADELLLYVVHGVLHLVGLRDKGDEDSRAMRAAELHFLLRAGVEPPATINGPHSSVRT